jgi:hypothetical protein
MFKFPWDAPPPPSPPPPPPEYEYALLALVSVATVGVVSFLNAPKKSSSKGDANWLVDFYTTRPLPPVLWGWLMNAVLLVTQCYWVHKYTSTSTFLKIGDAPIWQTYLILQLVCIAYSWVACTYLFPRYPTIGGIPFFLVAFPPAFAICAVPFFTDFGKEFAQNAPISVLTAWSAVRLMFESIVQMHAAYGVQGISFWLLWPVQTAPEPYTLTYPGLGWKVTRTRGGNVDAFSSLTVCLPVAAVAAYVNDDGEEWVQMLAWSAQVWIVFYLCVLGPVPHFLMGMPGPGNVFDGQGTPAHATRMHALTSGTLGTCCYWIASYAVIHLIVFVRKMTGA